MARRGDEGRPRAWRRFVVVVAGVAALVAGSVAVGPAPQQAEAAPTGCPCSVFPASSPSPVSQGSGAAVELGLKFRASVAGTVTGVRFWKSGPTTGTHVGRLWTAGGTKLAEASFTSESSSGWQQVSFSSPVQVSAGTTYVVSFYAPDGRYSATLDYFGTDRVSGPLTAPSSSASGGNGVYRYASGGGFPNATYRAANYWVDVVFDHPDTSPPAVTQRMPAPNATGVATTTAVSATFDEAVTAVSWSVVPAGGQPVTGTTTWDAGAWVSRFTPSQPLQPGTTYTATVSGARDAAGNTMTPVSWSFTTAAPDTTPPTVTGFSPGNGATDVTVTSPLTATFSEPVSATTVSWSLRGPSGAPVSGTASYDAATRTARFIPSAALAARTTYTVDLTGAADLAGNVMAPVSWSFTTGEATAVATIWPSSATPGTAVGSSASVEVGVKFRADRDGVITGVRFYKASANTGTHVGRLWSRTGTKLAEATFTSETSSGWQQVSFAQPVAVTAGTTYVASYLAPNGGYSYTSAAFASSGVTNGPLTALQNGVDGGNGVYVYGSSGGFPTSSWNATNYWVDVSFRYVPDTQPPTVTGRSPAPGATGVPTSTVVSAVFSEPVQPGTVTWRVTGAGGAVVAGTASYDATSRTATFTPGAGLAGTTTHSVTVSGAKDTSGNTMAETSWQFTTGAAPPDSTPPAVVTRSPVGNETAVPRGSGLGAGFDEAVVPGSATMTLATSSGSPVAGTATFQPAINAIGFRPDAPLAAGTTYRATVSGARDAVGNVMAATSWTFTTASGAPGPATGPGGPIAVVTDSSNPFSSYYLEILRAEGLHAYAPLPLSRLDPAGLARYDIVVLGDLDVSAQQAGLLTAWVEGGGRLVAASPDPDLAGVLGLGNASGTLANGYLAVDPATTAGAGITTRTMQYHGTADRWTTAGATTVARLYNDAGTATSFPAVTVRDVGSSGGKAAAFSYDLARSVVYTRQGNPAWAGQERDGWFPIRSNDLFFGGSSTDWIDLSRVDVPQADEQQRLLVNLLQTMQRDRYVLPKFWYFPYGWSAVIVSTGDDEYGGTAGSTAGRYERYLANSSPGCPVADWSCLRLTSYMTNDVGMSNSQASYYDGLGFESALHLDSGCVNTSSESALRSLYTTKLNEFRGRYPSLGSPRTMRHHCIFWDRWADAPRVEVSNGIRFDVNYYYFPDWWIQDRPGMFTGSGIPMRFAETNGSMIDVFQAPTQLTDESGMSYPLHPNTLLDRATSASTQYVGAFVTNMHTTRPSSTPDDLTVAAARQRGIPVVASRQMLSWLDARNNSSFGGLRWAGNTMRFTISADGAARGLNGMLPTAGPGGSVLSTLTNNGAAVSTSSRVTFKGVEYAFFPASSGSYVATYTGGAVAPTAAAVEVDASPEGAATLAWDTEVPSTSEVEYGTAPAQLDRSVTVNGAVGDHEVELTDLEPGRRYFYRVRGADPVGRPVVTEEVRSFTMPPADTRSPRVGDLRAVPVPDGTVRVSWTTDEPARGTATVTAADGTEITHRDDGLATEHLLIVRGLEPDTDYELRVTSTDEAGNEAAAPDGPPLAVRSEPAGAAHQTPFALTAGSVDGAAVVDDEGTGGVTLRGGTSAPRGTSGQYLSPVMDGRDMVRWTHGTWEATTPADARLEVSVRVGATPEPGSSWTGWVDVDAPGAELAMSSGRFLQYRLELTAGARGAPLVPWVGFAHDGSFPEPVVGD